MSRVFNRAFLVDAAERAGRATAQALGAVLVAEQAGLLGVDWLAALSVAGGAGLLSLLASVAAGRVGNTDTASFVSARRE